MSNQPINQIPTNNPNAYPQEETTVLNELILRYEQRIKKVFSCPNPYTKPLWEKSEIEQKVKELKRMTKIIH